MNAIKGRREEYNITGVIIILATLFLMWGLITGVNFMLIDELSKVFEMSVIQAQLILFTFFATYLIMALPAGKIINKYGYKNSIITGIVVAGFGCMLFYPAADNLSYWMFLLSNFIVASGITILQVGANAYVALLGSSRKAASRLTLVQAFNSLGAFLAPLFAAGLFMQIAGISEESLSSMSVEQLKQAQIKYVELPYLGLGAVLFLLALFIGFSKLPKLSTDQLRPKVKGSADKTNVLQFPHLVMAAIAIFCYVGAEVTIGNYLTNKAGIMTESTMADGGWSFLVPLYWGGALVGRFIGAGLLTTIDPKKLIATFSAISVILIILFIIAINASAGVETADIFYILALAGLFNSILFPCIFATGIDGLGKFSEEGSAILIMAIVGGAIVPFIWGQFFDQASLSVAFIIPLICYLYISFYGAKGAKYKTEEPAEGIKKGTHEPGAVAD